MYGQMYSIWGKCMVAVCADLSPAVVRCFLGVGVNMNSAARLTKHDTAVPEYECSEESKKKYM